MTLTGCQEHTTLEDQAPLRPVRTAAASSSPSDFQHRFAGTTISASTTNLSFQVSGTIDHFPAKAGARLRTGEVIASLNDDDLQLALKKNEALLQQATTNAQASTSRYQRMSELHSKKLISEMDYDVAKAEYQVSLAQIDQAQQAVDLSRQQIQYAMLHATEDHCSVTQTYVTENENVSAGQLIAVMSCGSIMEITANVSESTISNLRIGQPVEAIINAAQSEPLPAHISEIGLNTGSNGTYFVTAQLKNRNAKLRPGMAAELLINRDFLVNNESLWVPMNTVNETNGHRYVMTFEPTEGKRGLVRKVEIETGKFIAGSIEITQGLIEGQRVITAGLNQIYDGQEVMMLVEGDRS
ncbi:efflux RND transporter periplasmic adaptor subunit [Photobacterium satsumensis]|uniref:efflux RND transporter periplasmic adaptor subunit n=1 Tax=Photobacterium satsumensis TaxID=2910239 RepID=UPI003D131ECC